MSSKKIKNLVVDTTAFIKNANLRDIADNICTVQDVIEEITNDKQRRQLFVLPYDIVIKDVFTENIKLVTDVSKKTGDYVSLSATDIKVIALTYQLEKEKVGTAHLKTEPTMRKTVEVSGLGKKIDIHSSTEKTKNLSNSTENPKLGIVSTKSLVVQIEAKIDSKPEIEKEATNDEIKYCTESSTNSHILKSFQPKVETEIKNIGLKTEKDENEINEKDTVDLEQQIKNMALKDSEIDDLMVKVEDSEEDSESKDDSDSDEGEWITPSNITEKKKELDYEDYFEDKFVEVACMTSDFAMQNVLKQIGLNITSVNGRIIKQLRTFIFRCTTCFKTTSIMTKLFCPKCGHATLRKVSVSVDEEGDQRIHINGRKPLTARGKRFSLPTPKGGQHFQYPILSEDQLIHKRYATKLARRKNNPLDPEYTAGFSPFVMRDVNSKSAVLGVRANKQDMKYWMKHHTSAKKKK